MTCKGICMRHKASSRYATGHKRCQICDLFVQWDGVFCPCCGSRLRVGPRNIEDKAKLKKQKEIQESKNKKILCCPYNIKEEICCHSTQN